MLQKTFLCNRESLNKENKTFKCERHVSATPVPSSVYGWNYNDDQYIVERAQLNVAHA